MTTPTTVTPSPAPATPPVQSQQPATPPQATPAPSTPPPAPAPAAAVEPKKPLLATEEPAAPAPPKQEAAPESYQFVAPAGTNYDPVTTSAYEVIARDLGLSQESAQKMLDRIAPAIAGKLEAAADTRLDKLSDEIVAHPELGGANLKTTLLLAKSAVDQLGNPRLRALLGDRRTGVGSDLGMVEFLASIAKRFLRGDQLLTEERNGTPSASVADAEDYAERYPKMAARQKASGQRK